MVGSVTGVTRFRGGLVGVGVDRSGGGLGIVGLRGLGLDFCAGALDGHRLLGLLAVRAGGLAVGLVTRPVGLVLGGPLLLLARLLLKRQRKIKSCCLAFQPLELQ